MIHVIATINVQSDKRDEFLREFRKITPLVQAEAGCIEYGPTIDVETHIKPVETARPNTVTVLEKWESIDALQAHLDAPHMLQYRTRVKHLVTGARIHVTEPTD